MASRWDPKTIQRTQARAMAISFLPGVFLQPAEERPRLGEGHPLLEEGLQFDTKRRGVCDHADPLTFRKRDTAPLFGNDDTQSIRALRKTEGRRVSETEVSVPGGIGREGQMASETHDPVAVDQDGAVVSDRVGIENTLQQGLAEETIQVVSPGEVAVKGIFPLDHDQGADFLMGEIGGGLGDDLRAFVDRGDREELFPEPSQHGQPFEEAAEVLLEDDDQDKQQDREKALQYDRRQVELEETGEEIDGPEKRDADKNKAGSPVLEPDHQGRDHDRDDGDVEDVLDPEMLEHHQGVIDHVTFSSLHPSEKSRPVGLEVDHSLRKECCASI